MPTRPVSDPYARFWSQVHIDKECWQWIGAKFPSGYGVFSVKCGRRWRTVRSHRFSWELHYGSIPDGMLVCHKCDNPPCVRPDHLFLGTSLDNNRDKIRKGRAPIGEKHGRAILTESQVLEIRKLYATGLFMKIELARRFGVSFSCISQILNRTNWNHIR